MNEFLSIAIVGASLSVGIQWLKEKFGLDSARSKLLAIGASMAIGTLYFLLSSLAIWESMIGILAAASTMYALVYSGK